MIGKKSEKVVHITFDLGLICKGIFDLFEVLSGIALIFLPPERISHIIDFAIRGELSEDPTSFFAGLVSRLSSQITDATWHFMIFYLLSHGLIKLIMIVLLWKEQLWAYPVSMVMFGFFIYYQLVKISGSHSIVLIFLTAVDVFMIVLTLLEYLRIRREKKMQKTGLSDAECESKSDEEIQ